MSINEQKSAYINLASKGVEGTKEITGTTAVTPETGYYFMKLQFIADSVIAAQGDVTDAKNSDLTALTSIPAGTIIYGKFNSITLTSGEAIGYYAKG